MMDLIDGALGRKRRAARRWPRCSLGSFFELGQAWPFYLVVVLLLQDLETRQGICSLPKL